MPNGKTPVKKPIKPVASPAVRRSGTGGQMVAALASKAKFLTSLPKLKK